MEADWAKWVGRNRALKNADEEIDFQTDYVLDIARCKWQWMWWWWLVNVAMKVKLQEPRSFLKVSYNVPFSIMTQIKRDCGSDFPWDLDVGDMFKVLLLSPSPGWKPVLIFSECPRKVCPLLKSAFAIFVRSGTITRMMTSSPTETRALHQSSQVHLWQSTCDQNPFLSPGTQSPVHHTNFMYALDDSLDTFMHQTKKWKTQQLNERTCFESIPYQTKAWNLEH